MAKRKKKTTATTPVRGPAQGRRQGIQMTMMDYLTTNTNSSNRKRLSSRDVPSPTPGRRKTSAGASAPSTPVAGSTRNSHASPVFASTSASASTSARRVQLIVISSDDEDSPTPPPSKRRKVTPCTPPLSASKPPRSTRSVALVAHSRPISVRNRDADNDTPRTSKKTALGGANTSTLGSPRLQSGNELAPSQMKKYESAPPAPLVPDVPEIAHSSPIPPFRTTVQGNDDDDQTRIPPPTLDEYDSDEVPSSQTQLLDSAHMPNLFFSRHSFSSTSLPYAALGVPSFSTILTPRKKKLSHDSRVSSSQTPETLRITDMVFSAPAFGKSSATFTALSGSHGSPSRMSSMDNNRFITHQGRTSHSSQPTFAVPFPVTPTRKAKSHRRESQSGSVTSLHAPESVGVTVAASSESKKRLDCEIEGITATLRSLNPDATLAPSSPVPSESGSQTQSLPLPSFPSPHGSQTQMKNGGEQDFYFYEGSPTQDEVDLDANNTLDPESLTQDEFRGTSLNALQFNEDRDHDSSQRENEPLDDDRDASLRRYEYRLASESLYEESLRFTHSYTLKGSQSTDVEESGRGSRRQDSSLHQLDNRDLPARTLPSPQTRHRRSSDESLPSEVKTILYSETYEASLDKYILETQPSQILGDVNIDT